MELKGLAFKVTHNDGGASGGLIGYRGTCSDRTMVQNVEIKPKPWCSDPKNACRQFCDRGRVGRRPRLPCYESELLSKKPLMFRTGTYHSGHRKGEPIPIRYERVATGDIALLTTVPPGRPERDRVVFGCYMVGHIGEDETGHFIESDGRMDIVLPEDIAIECHYWDFQQTNTDGSKAWGSGLFRYLDQDAMSRFMKDLVYRLGDTSERDMVVSATGMLEDVGRPLSTAVSGRRSGGEGKEHLALKELVAKKPKLVGLPAKSRAFIEHPFLSGDRVDVMFKLPNGEAAVVEVETIVPLPGCHQAVKYRALMEVERSEPLGSGRVEAILVAHEFDMKTRELAKQYQVRLVELKA